MTVLEKFIKAALVEEAQRRVDFKSCAQAQDIKMQDLKCGIQLYKRLRWSKKRSEGWTLKAARKRRAGPTDRSPLRGLGKQTA